MTRESSCLASVVILLALAVLLFPSAIVRAADGNRIWPVDGVPVVEDPSAGEYDHRVIPDGAGGAVVVWVHEVTGAGGIRIQRLDASGTQLWTTAGVALSATGFWPSISPHPAGGAVVAWHETERTKMGIYVQRLSAAGSPLWTAGGVQVGTSGQRPKLCTTSAGGTFIVWQDSSGDARVAHVDDSGVPTAPGVNGISLGAHVGLTGDMAVVAAGGSSVIAVWSDDQVYSRILAQKVGPGLPWGTTPTVVGAPFERINSILDAAGDGAGGAVVAWRSFMADDEIRAQRIDSNGTTVWTTDGVVLVDSTMVGGEPSYWRTNLEPSIASDLAGGAFVGWTDWRHSSYGFPDDDVYAQHLSAGGIEQWATYGVRLSSDPTGSEQQPDLVADGVGGVILAYQEKVTDAADGNWEISAARLDSSGARHWDYPIYWDTYGDMYDQVAPQVAFDGTGPSPKGVVVVWRDSASDDLYAQKVEVSSPANDLCSNPTTVTAGDYEASLVGGTADVTASCGGTGSDLWYRFFAPGDGTLGVSTCGTHDLGGVDQGMDTVLSLHSACPSGGNLYELGCNDDFQSSADPAACAAQDTGLHRDSYVRATVSAGQAVLIRVSRYWGARNGPFLLHVIFEPSAPPNDACVAATAVGTGSYFGTLVGATTDGLTSCVGTVSDVWFRYTAPVAGPLEVMTCGSNDMPGVDAGIDSVLSLHSACPEPGNIHEMTCNDDSGFCGAADQGTQRDSRVAYAISGGETVWIRVARYAPTFDGEFLVQLVQGFAAAGRVPSDDVMGGPPMRVAKDGAGLRLTWTASCVPGDTDYAVYAGALGSFGLAEPLTCTTFGATSYFMLMPAGDVYFLVVPHNGGNEGSHGTMRLGSGPEERPQPPATCYPQAIGACS